MGFDYKTMIDRVGKDSIAVARIPFKDYTVKEGFSKLPMWIADMNFIGAPSITEALSERIKTEAYGYFPPKEEYFDSIIKWQKERNGQDYLTRDMIGYENGVLGGVASALDALCHRGGKVLVHSPTYVGFTGTLTRNGYKIVHSPLVKDENGIWRMDFEDMDKKLSEQNIHVAIFCSPHNPCGRVWEKWEIEKAMEVFKKNDCFVISDEIWSDLMINGHKHIPTLSVSEDARKRTVAMYAPSKTFNLAGLIGSYHIICDKYLRDRVVAHSEISGYNHMNVLSMHALIGAYSDGGAAWVDGLNEVLTDNVNYACDFIEKNFKGVTTFRSEGTYMLMLDCEEWCKEHNKTIDDVQKAGVEVGVIWQDGRGFHCPYGIRLNLALPTEYVKEAFDRLNKYVFNA